MYHKHELIHLCHINGKIARIWKYDEIELTLYSTIKEGK